MIETQIIAKQNTSETANLNQSIKLWPEQERPRERLLEFGAHSLSDAELLAIFLRSGSKQHSAVELARLLIQHFGGINPVFDAPKHELCQFHGMGESKYAQLMAVKELGRHYLHHYFAQERMPLNRSSLVFDYLRYELQGEHQEVFAIICLDSELRKISFKKLFFGSTNFCAVSIKQVLHYALMQHASAIIIAHNHPDGDAKPSDADQALTQKISHACQILEINLVDHIIVAKHAHFSFAEAQILHVK